MNSAQPMEKPEEKPTTPLDVIKVLVLLVGMAIGGVVLDMPLIIQAYNSPTVLNMYLALGGCFVAIWGMTHFWKKDMRRFLDSEKEMEYYDKIEGRS